MVENNNKFDMSQILSMLDGDDLMENVSRLALLMGSPEKGESVKNIMGGILNQKSREVESASTRMEHEDPAVNLLLALKPFLSESRKEMLDDSMKAMNMSYFIRELKKMT